MQDIYPDLKVYFQDSYHIKFVMFTSCTAGVLLVELGAQA